MNRCCIVLDGEAMKRNNEEEEKNATRLKKLIKNEWTIRITCIYPANKCFKMSTIVDILAFTSRMNFKLSKKGQRSGILKIRLTRGNQLPNITRNK